MAPIVDRLMDFGWADKKLAKLRARDQTPAAEPQPVKKKRGRPRKPQAKTPERGPDE